jgi:hypothetical protein
MVATMRLLATLYLVFAVLAGTIPAGPALAKDISAGPIWNNYDAKNKCPAVCGNAGGRWNGNWHTVVQGRNSVCSCDFGGGRVNGRNFNAGPIWNDQHARTVCPAVCASHNRAWKGQWVTTVQGQMSVCTCYK